MAPCPIQIRSLQFWGKSNMRRWTPGTPFFAVLATNSARLWATIITTRTRAHLAVRRSLISYLIAYPQSIAQFSSSQRMIHGIRSGQIAASGINIVLVARREDLLKEVGVEFSKRYGMEHRVVVLDVSREDFIGQLASATDDLDIGLVVSNAGTGNPGEFLKLDRQLLQANLRLSTMSHLDITHHFGAKLAKRRRGGLILAGAMGAENGVPCMANDGAAKAYVHSLGEALHYEFKPLGVYVTVLAAGFTNTAVLEKFALDPKTMPM